MKTQIFNLLWLQWKFNIKSNIRRFFKFCMKSNLISDFLKKSVYFLIVLLLYMNIVFVYYTHMKKDPIFSVTCCLSFKKDWNVLKYNLKIYFSASSSPAKTRTSSKFDPTNGNQTVGPSSGGGMMQRRSTRLYEKTLSSEKTSVLPTESK